MTMSMSMTDLYLVLASDSISSDYPSVLSLSAGLLRLGRMDGVVWTILQNLKGQKVEDQILCIRQDKFFWEEKTVCFFQKYLYTVRGPAASSTEHGFEITKNDW